MVDFWHAGPPVQVSSFVFTVLYYYSTVLASTVIQHTVRTVDTVHGTVQLVNPSKNLKLAIERTHSKKVKGFMGVLY